MLAYCYSPALVEDFEFVISTKTLLKLNLIPRNISNIDAIEDRYSVIYEDENNKKPPHAHLAGNA